jgi:hypothetical protein
VTLFRQFSKFHQLAQRQETTTTKFRLSRYFLGFSSKRNNTFPYSTWPNTERKENALKNENANDNGKYRLCSKQPKKLPQRIKTFYFIEKTVDTNVFLVCLKNRSIFETLVSSVFWYWVKFFDPFDNFFGRMSMYVCLFSKIS